MEVVVTTRDIGRAKLYSQIITTNKPTPNFLQAGCPSCHPTNSEGKYITFHGLVYPKFTWGASNFVFDN